MEDNKIKSITIEDKESYLRQTSSFTHIDTDKDLIKEIGVLEQRYKKSYGNGSSSIRYS